MRPPPDNPTPADAERTAALRRCLDLDDTQLLAECEIHLHRTSGPGGQHRNKVSSAVRLHHRPSGFVVNGSERRSQHENKANAVKRLREAIAVGVRQPPPATIVWPPSVHLQGDRLKVSPSNPAYWHVLALALDELAACDGHVANAAALLGVTTSSLTRFLSEAPKAWIEANRIRQAANLPPLRQ